MKAATKISLDKLKWVFCRYIVFLLIVGISSTISSNKALASESMGVFATLSDDVNLLVLRFVATPNPSAIVASSQAPGFIEGGVYRDLITAGQVCKRWQTLCSYSLPWSVGCIDHTAISPLMIKMPKRGQYVAHQYYERAVALYDMTRSDSADTPEQMPTLVSARARAFQLFIFAAMGGHELAQARVGCMALNEAPLECVSLYQTPEKLASFYRRGIERDTLTCGDERVDRIFAILTDEFHEVSETERRAANDALTVLQLEPLSVSAMRTIKLLMIWQRSNEANEAEGPPNENLREDMTKSLLLAYQAGDLTTEIEQYIMGVLLEGMPVGNLQAVLGLGVFYQDIVGDILTKLLAKKPNNEFLHYALCELHNVGINRNYKQKQVSLLIYLRSINCLNLLSKSQILTPYLATFNNGVDHLLNTLERPPCYPPRTDIVGLTAFAYGKIGLAIANPSIMSHQLMINTFAKLKNEKMHDPEGQPDERLTFVSRDNQVLVANSFNLLFSQPIERVLSYVPDVEYARRQFIDYLLEQLNICHRYVASEIYHECGEVGPLLDAEYAKKAIDIAQRACNFLERSAPIAVACLRSIMLWRGWGIQQNKQAAFDLLAETEAQFHKSNIREIHGRLVEITRIGWEGCVHDYDQEARYTISCIGRPEYYYKPFFMDNLQRLISNSQVARDYLQKETGVKETI